MKKMPRTFRLLLVISLVICLCIFGIRTLSKIAWMAGWPRVTLALNNDPLVEAAALYKLGRFEEADEIYEGIGLNTTYNRGNTLAMTGNYELSLAYYNAVLFADRWDKDAAYNREIVASLVPPVIGEAMGKGRVEAVFKKEGIDVFEFDKDNPMAPVLDAREKNVRELRKPLDERSITADRAWLDSLADAPGEYLANRLAAEHLRRMEGGELHSPEQSPW